MAKGKSLEYYLKLNYPVTLIASEDGGYVGKIKDLPGCVTQGETLEEVMTMIADAKEAWIRDAYESGDAIPLPREDARYSGQFRARVPKSLHRQLAERAADEGVSLNQLVVSLLSSGIKRSKSE